jgi:SAM-dependent methyltransferase
MTGPNSANPERALEQLKTREERYRLGQFATPEPIARFMGQVVAESHPTTVLDPAVGGGVLLRAVDGHVRRLGLDIDPDAVRLASLGLSAFAGSDIREGDFLNPLAWPFEDVGFDAIIANPPYIRHHNLSDSHKGLARHYSLLFKTKVSALSGSYAYFFFEAIRRLRTGGRLVFITPTEFLDARYGEAVKHALLTTCEINEILVLHQDELAFADALTTSAITIATKTDDPRGPVTLTEASAGPDGVRRSESVALPREALAASLPWTPLLPTRARRLLPLLQDRPARLGDYARFRRGIATGDNSFFCLSDEEVAQHGIEPEYLVPVVIGSRDLPRHGSFTLEHWIENRHAGRKAWLLRCHDPKSALVGKKVLRYVEIGEARGLPDRFNCRSRIPWYGVEPVAPPDFFVTYMSRDAARFVRNVAGARCMTSLLNVWAKPPYSADALESVLHDPINAVLLREFGRTYGGGLGKIEPGDLAGLPVPRLPAPAEQRQLALAL